MRRNRRIFRNDPDGLRLPVKLDTTTNGEFAPIPLSAEHALANEMAMRDATRHARGLGISRREFLVSAAGTATALLAMNAAYATAGNIGRLVRAGAGGGEGSRRSRGRNSGAASSSSTCRVTSSTRSAPRASSGSRAPPAPA